MDKSMMIRHAVAAACAVCVVTSGFVFGTRSNGNLKETRIEVQQLANCAIQTTPIDFVVIDGGRTAAEHKVNVANGKSWTTRSRHQDGAAIDYAALVDGKITYDPEPYYKIAAAFKACSAALDIPIVWGGDWKVRDLMHVELDRRYFP